jgi:hypothetical protein
LDVVFSCGNTFFAGRFDAAAAKVIDLVPLISPIQGSTDVGSEEGLYVADVRIDGKRNLFFIQDTLSDQRRKTTHQLRIWAYNGRPRLLATRDLITDWIPAGSSIADWFNISHPPVLFCDLPAEETSVCTEPLDSIFQTNLRNGKTQVLFYPAGVRRASDGPGYYAFFARGGFRLFIIRLGLH